MINQVPSLGGVRCGILVKTQFVVEWETNPVLGRFWEQGRVVKLLAIEHHYLHFARRCSSFH